MNFEVPAGIEMNLLHKPLEVGSQINLPPQDVCYRLEPTPWLLFPVLLSYFQEICLLLEARLKIGVVVEVRGKLQRIDVYYSIYPINETYLLNNHHLTVKIMNPPSL